MRIDQLLVERGLASSRSQAQRLIASGVRWMGPNGWKKVAKNGDETPDDAEIELLDAAEARYVSRGGLKLEGALTATGVDVTGMHCLDVGQSTGGFTDCLLQRGAAHVTGVDVGYGQLHAQLRADPRVTCFERINARDPDAINNIANEVHSTGTQGQFGLNFDLITGDLSFISSTLVLPAVVPHLKPGGTLLMLVKPQFELQPAPGGQGRHRARRSDVCRSCVQRMRGLLRRAGPGHGNAGWDSSDQRRATATASFWMFGRRKT